MRITWRINRECLFSSIFQEALLSKAEGSHESFTETMEKPTEVKVLQPVIRNKRFGLSSTFTTNACYYIHLSGIYQTHL